MIVLPLFGGEILRFGSWLRFLVVERVTSALRLRHCLLLPRRAIVVIKTLCILLSDLDRVLLILLERRLLHEPLNISFCLIVIPGLFCLLHLLWVGEVPQF